MRRCGCRLRRRDRRLVLRWLAGRGRSICGGCTAGGDGIGLSDGCDRATVNRWLLLPSFFGGPHGSTLAPLWRGFFVRSNCALARPVARATGRTRDIVRAAKPDCYSFIDVFLPSV